MKREGRNMHSILDELGVRFPVEKKTGKEAQETAILNPEEPPAALSGAKQGEVLTETLHEEPSKGSGHSNLAAREGEARRRGMSLQVTIDEIPCPAYLLNNNFEIDWINPLAEEKIFRRSVRTIREAENRNVFRLLLRCGASSRTLGSMDLDLCAFHMSFVKAKQTTSFLSRMYGDMASEELEYLEKLYERSEAAPHDSVKDLFLETPGLNGKKQPYHVYYAVFREGILFVYGQVERIIKGVAELLSSRDQVVRELMKQRMPTLTSFCVLVADLQESSRICAELAPEEYFELINEIWKTMEGSFRSYYGMYGKHVGDGMVYYFLRERDSNYLMNSIACSVELKANMARLSYEWKLRKGWSNDLYLNIGINEGQEFFGTIPTAPNIEFTALGDSVNYASRLSDFARRGSIWTTKNLINKLNEQERKRIRYGIPGKQEGREVTIENLYSRVMDMLPPENPKYRKFLDIAALPITQILSVAPEKNN
ncbi:MAG: adenylate/guanylate cyclase domain-containing protein [Syntrophaceae bacterium]|nr:adenylate/guanylate cyclase domain-containing protein [Syntrophaceae bacterium]